MLFFDLFRRDPTFIVVKRGEYLFREGDPGELMFVLISGEAEIMVGDLSIEICNSGDIVGEMALVDGSPRSASVIARTDCEFAVIDRKRFGFLVDETPTFAVDVMRVMAQRLKQCDQRLMQALAEKRASTP